jgi:hypothetical protein
MVLKKSDVAGMLLIQNGLVDHNECWVLYMIIH